MKIGRRNQTNRRTCTRVASLRFKTILSAALIPKHSSSYPSTSSHSPSSAFLLAWAQDACLKVIINTKAGMHSVHVAMCVIYGGFFFLSRPLRFRLLPMDFFFDLFFLCLYLFVMPCCISPSWFWLIFFTSVSAYMLACLLVFFFLFFLCFVIQAMKKRRKNEETWKTKFEMYHLAIFVLAVSYTDNLCIALSQFALLFIVAYDCCRCFFFFLLHPFNGFVVSFIVLMQEANEFLFGFRFISE